MSEIHSPDPRGDGDAVLAEPLREDYAPWDFWETASSERRADQRDRIAALVARGFTIGEECVVSALAAVHPDTFVLGDRSYVAAHAHVTGDVVIGADCSVNVGVAILGLVRTGRAVRIGAHTSLLGFDHGFTDTDLEVFRQPLTTAGITIGDDVWLGAHVVVVDGVRIGSHAVVGAGSVVTRDVADWAVVAGNPARVLRDRRTPKVGRHEVRAFAERARRDLPAVLDRAWAEGRYHDAPGTRATRRAHGDAVELAMLLTGAPPPELNRWEHVTALRAEQDRRTGLVPEVGGVTADHTGARELPDHAGAYHVLSLGYALDLLGSSFEHPVSAIDDLEPEQLIALLDALPWRTNAWGAGAVVDSIGTALTWQMRAGRAIRPGLREALLGWLEVHRELGSGLWGESTDLRDAVNGAYRLIRGTFAQWGVRSGPDPALARSVLRRAEEIDWATTTACDALDVVYLLRWSGADTLDRAHVRRVASEVLRAALGAWVPGAGVPFDLRSEPTLQGTEMWLAVTWYAADLIGLADALGYRPAGVHRPEPMLNRG